MQQIDLQLSEATDLVRIGVKGPQSASWLAAGGVHVPNGIHGWARFGASGIIVRQGGGDFFIEGPRGDELLSDLQRRLAQSPPEVYDSPRCDAAFSLTGAEKTVLSVLAQTCGLDFRTWPEGRVAYTRVAGVTCCLLSESREGTRRIRAWLDPSYADYLWRELTQIIEELGGSISGNRGRAAPHG